jgi:hypothetical protein
MVGVGPDRQATVRLTVLCRCRMTCSAMQTLLMLSRCHDDTSLHTLGASRSDDAGSMTYHLFCATWGRGRARGPRRGGGRNPAGMKHDTHQPCQYQTVLLKGVAGCAKVLLDITPA